MYFCESGREHLKFTLASLRLLHTLVNTELTCVRSRSQTARQRSVQVKRADAQREKQNQTPQNAHFYSKYAHKVETYQVVYSQRLWAQDVYQLPPDSCVGWPAVNCVSDSLLLLLIVSISVPAEEWGCCGQTQAIDLQLVPEGSRSYVGVGGAEARVGHLSDASSSGTWKEM